jgi:hypothetical protein
MQGEVPSRVKNGMSDDSWPNGNHFRAVELGTDRDASANAVVLRESRAETRNNPNTVCFTQINWEMRS